MRLCTHLDAHGWRCGVIESKVHLVLGVRLCVNRDDATAHVLVNVDFRISSSL
jgi:hypothetical protein